MTYLIWEKTTHLTPNPQLYHRSKKKKKKQAIERGINMYHLMNHGAQQEVQPLAQFSKVR